LIAVDTSVIVAIFLREPEYEDFRTRLIAEDAVVSGHVLIEALMVLTGRGRKDVQQSLESLVSKGFVRLVPFDDAMTRNAQQAFLDYGKGRHPARLNFGDCMSYALAKTLAIPLLWKGDDFDLTDIDRAA
jgi:ribonuclease VapC